MRQLENRRFWAGPSARHTIRIRPCRGACGEWRAIEAKGLCYRYEDDEGHGFPSVRSTSTSARRHDVPRRRQRQRKNPLGMMLCGLTRVRRRPNRTRWPPDRTGKPPVVTFCFPLRGCLGRCSPSTTTGVTTHGRPARRSSTDARRPRTAWLREGLDLKAKVQGHGAELSTLALSQGQRNAWALARAASTDGRNTSVRRETAPRIRTRAFPSLLLPELLPALKRSGKTVVAIHARERTAIRLLPTRVLKLEQGRLVETHPPWPALA